MRFSTFRRRDGFFSGSIQRAAFWEDGEDIVLGVNGNIEPRRLAVASVNELD